MTSYQTKAVTVGDFTATISKAGKSAAEKVQALIEAISTEIDNSLPGGPGHPSTGVPGRPDRPSQGLPPSPGHPDQGLPSGGRPDQGLPPSPGHPDQGLPSGGHADTLPVSELAKFLKAKAKELAAAALKDTMCDPAKPK